MRAIEQIFQGYYAERLNNDRPDPDEITSVFNRILKAVNIADNLDATDIIEDVSNYGLQAEKIGFVEGFRMAWDLWKNMNER